MCLRKPSSWQMHDCYGFLWFTGGSAVHIYEFSCEVSSLDLQNKFLLFVCTWIRYFGQVLRIWTMHCILKIRGKNCSFVDSEFVKTCHEHITYMCRKLSWKKHEPTIIFKKEASAENFLYEYFGFHKYKYLNNFV